ncbi:hypothetical protein [Massilia sp. TWR1-2-2]|uniref:hypothetical protein n=1 Tax=Massilia sp. TWR1-2-2 TaxID=2804584 RepID=UPI003CF257CC
MTAPNLQVAAPAGRSRLEKVVSTLCQRVLIIGTIRGIFKKLILFISLGQLRNRKLAAPFIGGMDALPQAAPRVPAYRRSNKIHQ